jgi:hypothetical protein
MRASVLLLLGIVPNDLIVRLRSISGKASSALGRVFCSLQSKQVLPEPNKQRSDDQNCKGGETEAKPGKRTLAIGLSRS